jgi:cbb3-type cytochrome oxidase subunit 3
LDCAGSWVNLEQLYFISNLMHDEIPSEFALLTQLNLFGMSDNYYTGKLPNLGSMTKMAQFLPYSNYLSGTLPSELGLFGENAEDVELDVNLFTGTFPSEYGNWTRLHEINVAINSLSGSLPSELGMWSAIEKMSFSTNFFTGPISPEIGNNKDSVVQFLINNNAFSGPLPSTLAVAANMEAFNVANNLLTSTLPVEAFETWKHLSEVYFTSNYLSGSFPVFNSRLMTTIQTGTNYFSGNLDRVFPANVSAIFPLMLLIDIGNCGFTGSFPNSLFNLPAIESLSATSNCFSGELTCGENTTDKEEHHVSKIKAQSLIQLSLNGLSSGVGCRNYVLSRSFYSNSGYYPNAYMHGSIPSCFWSLENLTALYLEGNGFQGPIAPSEQVFAANNLVNLSLASNELTGSVPDFIWTHPRFISLDLSSNRLRGQFPAHTGFNICTNDLIDLTVNRLSGSLPTSSGCDFNILSGNALQGNMFQFELTNVDAENQLAALSLYGSYTVDIAMIVSSPLLLVALIVAGIVAYLSIRSIHETGSKTLNTMIMWHQQWQSMKLPRKWEQVMASRVRAGIYSVLCAGGFLLYFVLTYCLLKLNNSAIYQNQYSWFPSTAYMHGAVPAVIISVGIAFVLLVFGALLCIILYLPERSKRAFRNTETAGSIDEKDHSQRNSSVSTTDAVAAGAAVLLRMALVFFMNFAVMALANAGYLIEVLNNSPYIQIVQFSLSVFKLLWNQIFISSSLRWMKSDSTVGGPVKSLYFRYTIRIFNFFLVPCFATSIIADSCFLTLFQQQSAPSIFLPRCVGTRENINGTLGCDGTEVNNIDDGVLYPPFVYSYQCTSALITNYIPVLLYSYLISGLLVPGCMLLYLYWTDGRLDPKSRLGRIAEHIDNFLPLVLRSHVTIGATHDKAHQGPHGKNGPVIVYHDSKGRICHLLPVESLISTQFLNATLFATFGLAFPYLGGIIIVGASMEILVWLLAVGRFHARSLRSEISIESGSAVLIARPSEMKDNVDSESGVREVSGNPLWDADHLSVASGSKAGTVSSGTTKTGTGTVTTKYSLSERASSAAVVSHLMQLTLRSLSQVRAMDCIAVAVIAFMFWGAIIFDMVADMYGSRQGIVAMLIVMFCGPIITAACVYGLSFGIYRLFPEGLWLEEKDFENDLESVDRPSSVPGSQVDDRYSLNIDEPMFGPLSFNSKFDEQQM